MIILITGANFNNKGAQLMLYALNAKIKGHLPQAVVCVSPLLGNFETLQKLNIKTLNFPLYHYGDGRKFILAFILPYFLKLYLKNRGIFSNGEIALSEVNVVMDISGYAFGDKWGDRPTKNLLYFVRKMKKNGSKFFLLPQAFGPFRNAAIKKSIRKVIQNVDLIFAREMASYEYLSENQIEISNIFIAPDITLTFHQHTNQVKNLPPDYCIIVPNSQMLIRANKSWQESYIEVLVKAMNLIFETSDLNILVLNHAKKNSYDDKIADGLYQKYQKKYSERIFLYQEDDPITIKSIISKSKFLLGSRFHALASALSSNVPCISTSWLHKYEMLFKGYKCEEYNFNKPEDEIYSRIIELMDDKKRKIIIKRLSESNRSVQELEKEMWNLIIKKIF
jgi:polysaccharide pyruvyl transferase WcaK-like protein